MAYPPRDMAEFKNYVARIVGHYKGRIRDWEVFNESLYTSYSLPHAAGFKMADYLHYQEAFIEAARKANPDAGSWAAAATCRSAWRTRANSSSSAD